MRLYVDGEEVEFPHVDCTIEPLGDRLVVKTSRGAETAVAVRSGDAVLISFRGRQFRVDQKPPRRAASSSAASGELRAPMPGQIVDILAAEGDSVAKGDKILVLEAMKTQQAFTAPFDGTVKSIGVQKGDQVGDGDILALVSPAE